MKIGKIKLALVLIFLAILPKHIMADEGMWLPIFMQKLNIDDMQRLGLKLSAEEIYTINNSSLKDAIVQFGEGCTGEIVSPNGLLFTNHHCGYGQIQAHSSVEHDYLSNGFWAQSYEEELPNPGLTVKFLVRMEDVTERVLSTVNDQMSEKERKDSIRAISAKIKEEATQGTHYSAKVLSYFEGNEYYLLVYEIFKDIRLVGTPPNSIGKFGADADNWMWPRHTGDFSVFRVYSAPDGSPAEYSKENIPYKPKHFLPMGISGIDNGDFAMIMGYPGSTDRFLSSYGVEQLIEIEAPSIVDIRTEKLAVYDKYMKADPKVRIQYASKHARVANYWKYCIGQGAQLKHNKVADKKREIEAKFEEFAKSNPKYSNVLASLEKYYKERANTLKYTIYTRECLLGTEGLLSGVRINNVLESLKNKDSEERLNKVINFAKNYFTNFYKDYNLALDKAVCAKMMEVYFKNVPEEQIEPDFLDFVNKHKNDYKKIAELMYSKTFVTDSAKVFEYLNNPSIKKAEADMLVKWGGAIQKHYFDVFEDAKTLNEEANTAKRLFISGIREMNKDKKYAPDANLTMRLTYGSVKDYIPRDAVKYKYYTTIEGIMEKEDPNNPDFIVPEKLKQLYLDKDYGRYGDSTLNVCFLTTNDITGGNSGSPIINAKGELIGLAFDGNWEAMSGDIYYEENLQRTIGVDIRYVLFIIDKYAGAQRLIDELVFSTEK